MGLNFKELETSMDPQRVARAKAKAKVLVQALIKGEKSGKADYSLDRLMGELDKDSQVDH